MGKKKSSRGCLATFLFFLLFLAALFYFSAGTGGGGGGNGGGTDPGGASPDSRAETFADTVRSAAQKIGAALSPESAAEPKPIPVSPVPDALLAAWSAQFSAGSPGDPAEPVRDPPQNGGKDGENPGASEPRQNAAGRLTDGLTGVVLLRYNPPTPETGFSVFLEAAGHEPVPVEGRTTQEFCGALSRRLGELAKTSNGEYTRFYALETDDAGPSQTRWLSETVREKFPGIIFETKSSTKDDHDAPNQN